MSYNGKHPAQVAQELQPLLAYVMDRSKPRVLSVDLNIGGEAVSIAYKDGVGQLPEHDRPLYSVGCVMDMIYSIIAVSLHHHAGLRLDDPVEAWVPEVISAEAAGGPPITLQHLLTRTSGIQDPRSIEEMRAYVPWEEMAPRIQAAPRLFSPGVAFNYGGIDRSILAVALMRFANKAIARLADEFINDPCGLIIRPEQLAPDTGDGIRRAAKSDTAHMAKVGACLAAGGVDGLNAFSEPVRTYLQVEKLSISRSIKAPPWPHAPSAFTLGLFKFSDSLIGFNGFDSGESCSVRYDPQGALGFSVALEGPPAVRDYIVGQIAERLGFNSAQSRAIPCTVGSLNGLQPDEIVGEYIGWADGYRATVRLEDEGVVADLLHQDRRFRQVRIRMEERAWLVADNAAHLSSLEFFRDTRTGRVCMASGGVPYAMARSHLH